MEVWAFAMKILSFRVFAPRAGKTKERWKECTSHPRVPTGTQARPQSGTGFSPAASATLRPGPRDRSVGGGRDPQTRFHT